MGERNQNITGGVEQSPEEEQLQPLFALVDIVGTPGALQAIQEAGQNPAEFLIRHVTGDWSELPEEDQRENELALDETGEVQVSQQAVDEWQQLSLEVSADGDDGDEDFKVIEDLPKSDGENGRLVYQRNAGAEVDGK